MSKIEGCTPKKSPRHRPIIVNREPSLINPVSQLATEVQCRSDAFRYWCEEIHLPHEPILHRKLWEFCYILQALAEGGMMAPGRRGLGFGVGKEPIVSLLADRGCEILATDLEPEEATKQGWVSTNQHALSLDQLNERGICPPDRFVKQVKYRMLNMNYIEQDLVNFDFVWSSCALEHLGSIELGLNFIKNSLHCLKPGGLAVHTTEFNLSSNDLTIDNCGTVLFRRQDIDKLATDLLSCGHKIILNYNTGSGELDHHVDVPPWSGIHLKVQLERYVTTSLGLIIKKTF